MGLRAFDHHGADEVVSDDMHGEFFLDHRRSFAAKYVHAHSGFDVPQIKFGLPASSIEISECLFRESFWIKQSRDDDDVFGSEAFDVHMNFYLANKESFGESGPLFLTEPFRVGPHFVPFNKAVVLAESFYLGDALCSLRMIPHDAVDPALRE